MKAFFPLLAFVSAFAPVVLFADAMSENAPADSYLFAVGVGEGRFVSLVPFGDNSPFFKDSVRSEAWKRRVAEKTGAKQVDIRQIGEEIGVDKVNHSWNSDQDSGGNWFLDWVEDGDTAISVMRTETDGGVVVTRTNEFSVSHYDYSHSQDGGLRLIGGDAVKALRADCGVGQSVWVLPWEDLKKRWEKENDLDKVRKAWNSIRDGGRCEKSAPGGSAWRERLDKYRAEHRELWVGFFFQNEKDEVVEVRYRAKGDAKWTGPFLLAQREKKEMAALKDPRGGYDIEWQIRPAGSTLGWDNCRMQDPERIDEANALVFINFDLNPFMAPPKLRFTGQIFEGEEFLGLVPALSIDYETANGTRTNTQAFVTLEGGTPVAELLPGLKILEIRMNSDGKWFQMQSLPIGKPILNCGEKVAAPRLKLLPWPELEIENASKTDIKGTVALQYESNGDGGAKSFTLKSNGKEEKALALWTDATPPETIREAKLEIVAKADNYEDWRETIAFRRGQDAIRATINMEPKKLDWPSADEIKDAFNKCRFLATILTPSRTTKVDESEIKQYFETITATVAAQADKHLKFCQKKDCGEHTPFEKRHSQELDGKQGKEREIELFVALWTEAYPRMAPKEYSQGITKEQRLRQLLRYYILGESGGMEAR